MNPQKQLLDFKEKTKEIEILLSYAKRNTNPKNIEKYATFIKAALILLCAKFESFIETFIEDFITEYLSKTPLSNIQHDFKHYLVNLQLDRIQKSKPKKQKRNELLEKLVLFYTDNNFDLNTFKLDYGFNYGKHGEEELKKVLIRFGLSDFIKQIENDLRFDFFNKFNSLTNIRNNILHQDETPSLTHQQVDNYYKLLIKFSDELNMNAFQKLNP